MGHKGRDGGTWGPRQKGGSEGAEKQDTKDRTYGSEGMVDGGEGEKDNEDETYSFVSESPASTSPDPRAQRCVCLKARNKERRGALGVRVYMALGVRDRVSTTRRVRREGTEERKVECGELRWRKEPRKEWVLMEEVECGVDWDGNRAKKKGESKHGERRTLFGYAGCTLSTSPGHPTENVRKRRDDRR
jgi:hypothetical protein